MSADDRNAIPVGNWPLFFMNGTGSSEIRRNKASIQGGEQTEWPRLVRALAIVGQYLTCNGLLAYYLGK